MEIKKVKEIDELNNYLNSKDTQKRINEIIKVTAKVLDKNLKKDIDIPLVFSHLSKEYCKGANNKRPNESLILMLLPDTSAEFQEMLFNELFGKVANKNVKINKKELNYFG